MADRFEDHRGLIEDLLVTPLDSVTRISTKAGCVRGNHVHRKTTQWCYVISGLLLMAQGPDEVLAGPGDLYREEAGVPHAWRAVEDTTVLVFTRGPRSGDRFEDDTERLKVPLLAPREGDTDTREGRWTASVSRAHRRLREVLRG